MRANSSLCRLCRVFWPSSPALGCGLGQGYFYGKPADADATLRYLSEHYPDMAAAR